MHLTCVNQDKDDSKFVSKLADKMWSTDELKERSVEGRRSNVHKDVEAKNCLSPDKVLFIIEKMRQRVDDECGLPTRYSKARITKILNVKCTNLRRKKEK